MMHIAEYRASTVILVDRFSFIIYFRVYYNKPTIKYIGGNGKYGIYIFLFFILLNLHLNYYYYVEM